MNKAIYIGLLLAILPFATAQCYDFDNGIMPYLWGFVVNEQFTINDYCHKDMSVVTEYYCNNGSIASVDFKCDNGCNNKYIYSFLSLYPANMTYYNGLTFLEINNTIGACNSHPSPSKIALATPIISENNNEANETNETEVQKCCNDYQCATDEKCINHVCTEISCNHGFICNHKCISYGWWCINQCQSYCGLSWHACFNKCT